MKKAVSIVLLLMLCLSLIACRNNKSIIDEITTSNEITTPITTQAKTTESTSKSAKEKASTTSKETTKKSTATTKAVEATTKKQVTTTTEQTTKSKERCTNDYNHGMETGETKKWYSSKDAFLLEYDNLCDYWGDKLDNGEITYEEYWVKSPQSYVAWQCQYCGKWTGSYHYGQNSV